MVAVSVGDSKLFKFDSYKRTVFDITYLASISQNYFYRSGSRLDSTDPKDPGGRIGPWNDGAPDYRNLAYYFCPCNEGIFIIYYT